MKSIFVICLVAISTQAKASGFDFRYAKDLFGSIDHLETHVYFDKTEAQCLVDTGARFTLAKESLVRENIKVGETQGGGLSGKENITDLVQSNVQVGDWQSLQNIIGRKSDNQIPFDCLLGNDFFMHRDFSIDFVKMKFSDETSFQGEAFPLNRYPSDQGGHFGFTIDIEGENIESLFDTGATNTVFDLKFVEAHQENFEFLRELDVTEGSNQSIKAGVYRAKSIRFGKYEDRDVEVYVVSLEYLQSKIPGIKAVLGLNQMKDRKWYFSQNNLMWSATPK